MSRLQWFPWIGLLLWCGGCSFEPHRHEPLIVIPDSYKETDLWQPAKPKVANDGNPCWWEIYQDPILNQLEQDLNAYNQDVKIAFAQYEGALAALKIANSAKYPSIYGDFHAQRIQNSNEIAPPPSVRRYDDYLLGTNLSYEIDLWGKVRNSVKASKNLAFASRDDLEAIALSLQATLASTYFSYRGTEATIRILSELKIAYEKALELTQHRFQGGIAPESDVDQALTQLENVKTQLSEAKLKHAQYEHALAILVGVAPVSFSIAPANSQSPVIPIAVELPSVLLERRPDIAAAQRRVQSANALIGVARAAFFPSFNLVGTIFGVESKNVSSLLNASSLYWTLGPSASTLLFDGGNLKGKLDQAKASYHETVASYRQTVLNALQEVEDNLAAQRELENENVSQSIAVESSKRALQQAYYRYDGGIATYLDVVVLQNTALVANLALIDIHTRRQQVSVQLIRALGGGWQNCDAL